MNNEQNIPSSGGGKMKKILIVVVGLLIIAAIIALVVFMTIDYNKNDNYQNESIGENTNSFPESFYSYKGIITAIEEGKIMLMARADQNYLKADTEMTVLVNQGTTVNKIKVATKAELDNGATQLIKREPTDLASLAVGDEVVVIAGENINGKTEFVALTIEKDK